MGTGDDEALQAWVEYIRTASSRKNFARPQGHFPVKEVRLHKWCSDPPSSAHRVGVPKARRSRTTRRRRRVVAPRKRWRYSGHPAAVFVVAQGGEHGTCWRFGALRGVVDLERGLLLRPLREAGAGPFVAPIFDWPALRNQIHAQ